MVGMSGGEIFHEMMLRQGVKHVCEFSVPKIVYQHPSNT